MEKGQASGENQGFLQKKKKKMKQTMASSLTMSGSGGGTKGKDLGWYNKDNQKLLLWTHCQQPALNQIRHHRESHEEPELVGKKEAAN